MSDIPEADWKHIRALQPLLINRLCARINARVGRIINDPALTHHERFLTMFTAIREENQKVAWAFDDWRRSTIRMRIIEIHRQGLFEPGEIAGLSDAMRQRLLDA